MDYKGVLLALAISAQDLNNSSRTYINAFQIHTAIPRRWFDTQRPFRKAPDDSTPFGKKDVDFQAMPLDQVLGTECHVLALRANRSHRCRPAYYTPHQDDY